jgi:hypothetical protein
MTTTHPPKPATKPATEPDTEAAPTKPAPQEAITDSLAVPETASEPEQVITGSLALVFTPELNEPCLQSCRGGSRAWVFGPLSNPTTLRINPGLNGPIDRSLWEQVKERPDTQMLMGRSLLQEIELTDGATNADGELTLGAVSVPVANRLVYGCRNTEQLDQWLRKEDRQQLRERIAARIKEINDGKP